MLGCSPEQCTADYFAQRNSMAEDTEEEGVVVEEAMEIQEDNHSPCHASLHGSCTSSSLLSVAESSGGLCSICMPTLSYHEFFRRRCAGLERKSEKNGPVHPSP